MKYSKNLTVIAGLSALVAATYFGFGGVNRSNEVQAQDQAKAESKGTTASNVSLESEKAKLGYSFGANIGREMAQSGIVSDIDVEAFVAAIQDLATGAEARMTGEQMQQAQQAFQLRKQQEYAAIAEQNKTQGLAFLEKSKAEEGIVTTESGLLYQVVREGKGKQPTAADTVKIHYKGSLIDGTPFDSSYQRNQPADFPVTGVIPGFSEGLLLMKEGAKYRFVIPAEIAYGEQGPGAIGPNQVLIFEVEMLEVLQASSNKEAIEPETQNPG